MKQTFLRIIKKNKSYNYEILLTLVNCMYEDSPSPTIIGVGKINFVLKPIFLEADCSIHVLLKIKIVRKL